jgi:glutamate synthase domain-containing protein 3
VAGDVGNFSAFMAQAGVLLVGGDAGEALGDSLYEAVVYVGGAIKSLGSDAQVEEIAEQDVARVRELIELAGFTHVSPEDVTRVGSARQLYNFDAVKAHHY